jgi:tetratricopeptide (TPR) repeat protein
VTVELADEEFRLLAVEPTADMVRRAYDTPLVGRARELAALRRGFEGVCRSKRPGLVTVLGEAGIGKTRLARELEADINETTTILVGRCVPYGEGQTWLPLGEMLSQAGERLDSILAEAESTAEIFFETRLVFERLACARPVVLVFDDVHWAESTLLDFVEYLSARAAGPILCLCLSRPELAESRPALADGAIRLEPLSDDESEVLAAGVKLELRAGLVEAAGGNPLFLEQLSAFLREGGGSDAVPPSLEALIASRLDLLDSEEQDLLHRAAVVGRSFDRSLLLEIGGKVERLAGVTEKGVVRRVRGGEYRFHHPLVREVAYASLSKALRADLHERLADLLADRDANDELIGYHLERAHQLGDELHLLDRRLRRLASDAGARLGAAGVEAWKRNDSPAAVNLLTRACALLPERDSFRLLLLCHLASALHTWGASTRAEEVLVAAAETAAAARDRPREARAGLELAHLRLYTDPEGRASEVIELARAAIPLFEALGDQQGLGRAWRFVGDVEGGMYCRYAAAVEAAERALHFYELSGWPASTSVGDLAAFLYYGPTPVEEAVNRSRRLLAETTAGRGAVLAYLGGLESMRGHFDEARGLLAKARWLHEELGQAVVAEVNCGGVAARIEMRAGEYAAAEEILRANCANLERMGNRAYLATRATELAEVLWTRGDEKGAENWVSRAVELGASDDIPTQLSWRCVRGKLLARRGDPFEAEQLVRDAIRLSDTTDALNHQARARLALAQVLGIGGRPGEASAAGRAAIELFERKGNLAAADQARALVEVLV